jgi:hypothetical protein
MHSSTKSDEVSFVLDAKYKINDHEKIYVLHKK